MSIQAVFTVNIEKTKVLIESHTCDVLGGEDLWVLKSALKC